MESPNQQPINAEANRMAMVLADGLCQKIKSVDTLAKTWTEQSPYVHQNPRQYVLEEVIKILQDRM